MKILLDTAHRAVVKLTERQDSLADTSYPFTAKAWDSETDSMLSHIAAPSCAGCSLHTSQYSLASVAGITSLGGVHQMARRAPVDGLT